MAEDNIEARRRERLERLRSIQMNRQDSIDAPRNIILNAVQSEYKDISRQEADKITRELVLAPRKASIKIGDSSVLVSDLSYNIALSIEAMGAETSSEEEYFSWFSESSDIIKHMNDGFVSEEDLKEKNDWLVDSYSREAELMTCLGLLQNSSFPAAKEHYVKLYNKLVKLRQIRSSIKESTANKADRAEEKIDMKQKENAYKKAVVYVAATREFLKHESRWNMPKNTLKKLKIYHGNDDDLSDDYDNFYDFYEYDDLRQIDEQQYLSQDENSYPFEFSYHFDDWLKEDILFHWNDELLSGRERSVADKFIDMEPDECKSEKVADIREHIARLTGRRPPKKDRPLSYSMDRARAFDSVRYNFLTNNLQNA